MPQLHKGLFFYFLYFQQNVHLHYESLLIALMKSNLLHLLSYALILLEKEYEAHMNAPEQQAMFKEMGVKTFYIGKSLEDPKRATVMFQGPVNTCYDIFINPETKPIVEASGHIYEGTIINRWISE